MLLQSADIPGLVWAYRFPPQTGEAARLAHDCGRGDLETGPGFVWLHLNLADARVPAFLEGLAGLNEAARAALTTHDAHAAISAEDGIAFGTLVDFQRDFASETRDIGWLHFAITETMIVTTRLQPLRSIDRARHSIERNGAKYRKPAHVFETPVAEFQRRMIALAMELSEELNLIEDMVYAETPGYERRRLAPLRRTVARLHRHLRAVLASLRRAAASEEEDIPEDFEDVAHRLTARLEAGDHDVHALQDRARLLHEEIDSRLSSETNRHLYILSLMTAFLLPPSLVTGFFGMNTTALPFAEGGGGTAYAVVFMLLSVLAAWWLLKRTRIL